MIKTTWMSESEATEIAGIVGVINAAVNPARARRTLMGIPRSEKIGTTIMIAVTRSITSNQVVKISGITIKTLRSRGYTSAEIGAKKLQFEMDLKTELVGSCGRLSQLFCLAKKQCLLYSRQVLPVVRKSLFRPSRVNPQRDNSMSPSVESTG